MQAAKQAPNVAAQQKEARGALGRAVRYLGLHKKAVALAYGALVFATLAQLAVPWLISQMINDISGAATLVNNAVEAGTTEQALLTAQQQAESALIMAVAFVVGLAIVRALFSFVQTYMAEWTSQSVAYDLRNALFTKLSRLSFSYYDQHQTGQLMVRATDDIERLRVFIAQGLLLAVQAFILIFATLAILFATNWQLTMVIIPILPVSTVMFLFFGRISEPMFRGAQRRLSTLNTILQENVAGIKVVKAFVRQRHEQERFDVATDNLYKQWLIIAATFALLFPTINFISQVGQAAILYFAGPQIFANTLTLGDYQMFTLYLVYLFLPLGQLGLIISMMSQATASSERIFEILDTENDIQNKPDAIDLPTIAGEVAFNNVTFRYFSSSEAVLSNVNFRAKPGQTIALLGSTGSGKTTIINLIPRFYDVSEGAVTIDGYDVRDVTLDSLRPQIGIVLQETNLFSGSIRDNIAFGRPDATDEEVIEAAKAAAAHDFIMTFPDGYDTAVGERGSTLSGGQKQRVAIARALLLRPQVLILDDSTSSVDFATERLIQAALDRLMEGRTSFVIAQRISTVLSADQIIVLDKGQVAAQGTHDELMEDSPIYADIYNSQLVDDAAVINEEA